MKDLIPKQSWMKNTVTEEEAEGFNPDLGPCCDPRQFRLHLGGTTCDRWNKSATHVFTDDFLRVYRHEYPPEEEAVTKLVEVKTRAAIDSMIRSYRRSNGANDQAARDEAQARKNRGERRRKVGSITSTFDLHQY